MPRSWKGALWEGSQGTFRARLVDPDGTLYTSSTISSFAEYVYDLNSDTPQTAVYSATGTSPGDGSSGPVYDSLQTTGWDQDSTGYNFSRVISDSAFLAAGDHLYRVTFVFTTSADGALVLDYRVRAQPVASA